MTEGVQIALIAGGVAMIGGIVAQVPAIIISLRTRERVDATHEGLTETKKEMVALKEHVNSNTERLVESVKAMANKEGKEEGRAEAIMEGTTMATAVVVEVARAVEDAKIDDQSKNDKVVSGNKVRS